MESLNGHVVKFSLKYMLNSGQYDYHISRCDSFDDIPGHGEIFFLDRNILWTLKSNLVLFFGMSFAALYKSILEKHGQRCQFMNSGNCR